jgi:hypothetical protein
VDFVRDSDLLICEGMFAEELAADAQDKKHLTARQAARIASLGGVKRLGLIHYSPRYTDRELKSLLAEARELLEKAGCWLDGEIVRFPPHLVEWALRAAPSQITLCDRRGRPALELAGYKTYFGTGSDCPFNIDLFTGERRRSCFADVVNFARLVDGLPNIDFHMCMAIAQDLEQSTADIRHFEAMINNTTKPVCFTAWNLDNLKDLAGEPRLIGPHYAVEDAGQSLNSYWLDPATVNFLPWTVRIAAARKR